MIRPTAFLSASLAALLACGGCGEQAPPPAAPAHTSPAARTRTPPAVPGLNGNDSSADVLLLKRTPSRRAERYRWDDTMDSGALRVICRISKLRPRLPKPTPYDFSGKTPIKGPVPTEPYRVIHDGIKMQGYDIRSETDYYSKWNAPYIESPLTWVRYPPRGGSTLTVNGAAIILENIKAGAREELTRGRASINHRLSNRINGTHNYSGYGIAFVPVDEKIVFSSGDRFPCEIDITEVATGRALGEVVKVKPFTSLCEGKPGRPIYGAHPGWHPHSYYPPATASPVFRNKGIYSLRCRRHPWHTGYALCVDNPYVAVSGAQNARFPSDDGKVTIDKIPPGTWTVRVWHPLVEPAKELHEVTIATDETTHLIVEFTPPPELLEPAK